MPDAGARAARDDALYDAVEQAFAMVTRSRSDSAAARLREAYPLLARSRHSNPDPADLRRAATIIRAAAVDLMKRAAALDNAAGRGRSSQ